MLTPEQTACQKIDGLLKAAGWVIQNPHEFNRYASTGVAVREFYLPSGPCDYLLFVNGKAAGVVEAKKTGVTLSGVAEQSEKYMAALPEHLAKWHDTLVFDYETTGDETYFRNMRDPKPRSRRLFAFHRPETLLEWLKQPDTMRGRLREMPELITTGLRDCQIDAINGLEESLAEDRPRSLIQLAIGAGKTFTACSFSYRLIKHAGAKRILFLVDRNNLGDQTLKEFQNFLPPGTANHFAIALPPTEEQSEIVRLAEERRSQIMALEQWCETELKRSASLRQSILKDAFSGKLVPQDPNDEPART